MSTPGIGQAQPPAIVVGTTNGQTVTVVRDAATGAVTVRVAKDGHNRAVAKLDRAAALALSHALTDTPLV